MSREWISRRDHRWVMACNQPGCGTRSEPFASQPSLQEFADRGWWIAETFGDRCPACYSAGLLPANQPANVVMHHVGGAA